MNDNRRAAILAELEQFVGVPNLGPGEITSRDIEEAYTMTNNRANRWASEMVAAGKLEKVKRYDTRVNRAVNAWRPVPCDSAA